MLVCLISASCDVIFILRLVSLIVAKWMQLVLHLHATQSRMEQV